MTDTDSPSPTHRSSSTSAGKQRDDHLPAHPHDSVGTLLASIASLVTDSIHLLRRSDRRAWGPDEHDQLRALEHILDEARRDFQELGPLLNGQLLYEHDRTHDSLHELRALRDDVSSLSSSLLAWTLAGGPLDPIWIRQTHALQRTLHLVQLRAARRIFVSSQSSSSPRCLGAFLIHRLQRTWATQQAVTIEEGAYQKRYLEELQLCNRTGTFQRFGEGDVAFICDYCDGHLIWTDLEKMPSVRTTDMHESAAWPTQSVSAPTSASRTPHWQATGFSHSHHEAKSVVFAPVAIANHTVPHPGDWQAGILCPFCEDEGGRARDKDDEEDEWRQDSVFEDIAALEEHLRWEHTAQQQASTGSCVIM